MVVRTRITLGTRTTPRFVSERFYHTMKDMVVLYQIDCCLRPSTVAYQIPNHMVVERPPTEPVGSHRFYEVHLDDTCSFPRCRQHDIHKMTSFRKRVANEDFDRFRWCTEQFDSRYYMTVPNAMYHNVEIYTDWSISWLLYDSHIWEVHFRKVFVDPYDSSHTIWFHSTPKYQIILITEQDFRGRELELKQAMISLLPRAFRWDW